MLNEDNEKGLELDENYFPDENKVFVFGTHEVSTLALMQDDFKIFRRIQVKKNLEDPWMLDHYQLKNWKDKDANLEGKETEIFKFLRLISCVQENLNNEKKNSTLVIHC